MYSSSILAVSGALLSVVAAVPLVKRDILWITETAVDVMTIPVTTTVWVDWSPSSSSSPVEAAATYSHFGHHHHSTLTSTVQAAVTVSSSAAPVSESSSSVYVAPTTSSVYVAPTTSSIYVAPTTISVYVAPTTTSSVYVAPTTTEAASSYVAPTTASSAPAATSSAASGSGLTSGSAAAGTSYTGDLTWYDDGLGACGQTSGPSDSIVAISHVIFDSYPDGGNPNNNPTCLKQVSITGADGSEYTATVVDRCVGCNEGDLDLSEDFFNIVTNNGNGRVPGMSWKWL